MFKLIKWSLIGAFTLGTAAYCLVGDDLVSYATTVGSSVRDGFKESIPVDFEIKRAEKLIRQIQPEIRQCVREVARAEVELEQLAKGVKRLETTVAKQEAKLRDGSKFLAAAEASSLNSGSRYSRRRVEMDLGRTIELFKNNQAMLRSKRSLLERQAKAVTASKIKRDAIRTRQVELESSITALKVQKKHLDSLKAVSRSTVVDDSKLSQASALLADIKKRLDVTQKVIESDMFFTDGESDTTAPRRDVLKEINQLFPGSASAAPEKAQLSPRNGR